MSQRITIAGGEPVIIETEDELKQIVLFKLGTESRPAGEEDIAEFRQLLIDALEEKEGNKILLTTHHAVEIIKIDL